MRAYFSGKKQGAALITRRARAKEIFTLSLSKAQAIKLQPNAVLLPKEKTLLESLQSEEHQFYFDLPLKELPEESMPEFAKGVVAESIDLLPTILVKLQPQRCVVSISALLSDNGISALKKETLFVITKSAVAAVEHPVAKNSAAGPGYRSVTLELHLNKKGYPINFPGIKGTAGKIAIPGSTWFKVSDFIDDRLVLREVEARQLPDDVNNSNHLRKLYPGAVQTADSRLRDELTAMENLLQQDIVAKHLSVDFRARYIDVLLDMANKASNLPVIEEFTEAGSDFINNWLRFGIDDVNGSGVRASAEAADMLAEYALLYDFGQFAYRSAIYPAGVYKFGIKVGDVITDHGFMSASAIPTNGIEWLNIWTRNIATVSGDRVIMIFDKSVRKKTASGDFLVDHLLVRPGTPLKVGSIRSVQNAAGERLPGRRQPGTRRGRVEGYFHRRADDLTHGVAGPVLATSGGCELTVDQFLGEVHIVMEATNHINPAKGSAWNVKKYQLQAVIIVFIF